jgi:hypothetical protein
MNQRLTTRDSAMKNSITSRGSLMLAAVLFAGLVGGGFLLTRLLVR